MKLVASLLVRDEMHRYLREAVAHLLEFCNEVAVLDDNSTDGSAEWLAAQAGVALTSAQASTAVFEHEGRTRQQLLEWTLGRDPTHILAIDADEFVTDGPAVRRACMTRGEVWTLEMEEVWELDGDCICIRQDGGWRQHPVAMLYTVPPPQRRRGWMIADRKVACGRVPQEVRGRRARPSGSEVLHFGWANQEERAARHDRYVVADGGRFHAGSHLDSILWPDDRVTLTGRPWPHTLAARRPAVARAAGYPPQPVEPLLGAQAPSL